MMRVSSESPTIHFSKSSSALCLKSHLYFMVNLVSSPRVFCLLVFVELEQVSSIMTKKVVRKGSRSFHAHNMTLSRKDYCELKANVKKQIQKTNKQINKTNKKTLSALYPICLKAEHEFTKKSLLSSLPGRTKVSPHRQL